MIISSTSCHREIIEDNLKFFCCYDKIGIHDLKNDKKTMPFFDLIITSKQYIYIERDGLWGMLDKELRVILPTSFKEIYPLKKINGDELMSICDSRSISYDFTQSEESETCYFTIQNKVLSTEKEVEEGFFVDTNFLDYIESLFSDTIDINVNPPLPEIKEEDKAVIFEIVNKDINLDINSFALISNKEIYYIELKEFTVYKESELSSHYHCLYDKNLFLLRHYKNHLFIQRDAKGNISFLHYSNYNWRFSQIVLFTNKIGNNEDKIEIIPDIKFYKKDFISFFKPNYLNNSCNCHLSGQDKNGRWALFKYEHTSSLFNSSYFKQLTPFIFSKPLTQTNDFFTFICRELGKEFFVKYDNEFTSQNGKEVISVESNYLDTIQENYILSGYSQSWFDEYQRICFNGLLKISSPVFDSIIEREDNMYDVKNDDQFGLFDIEKGLLVPTKYDYPIEWGEQ